MHTYGLFTVGAKRERCKLQTSFFFLTGIKPFPLDSKSCTLPRRSISRLGPKGSYISISGDIYMLIYYITKLWLSLVQLEYVSKHAQLKRI